VKSWTTVLAAVFGDQTALFRTRNVVKWEIRQLLVSIINDRLLPGEEPLILPGKHHQEVAQHQEAALLRHAALIPAPPMPPVPVAPQGSASSHDSQDDRGYSDES